jgi:hypothetical protein
VSGRWWKVATPHGVLFLTPTRAALSERPCMCAFIVRLAPIERLVAFSLMHLKLVGVRLVVIAQFGCIASLPFLDAHDSFSDCVHP